MNPKEITLWGIHSPIEIESVFLKKNLIAVGWYELGDLKLIKNDREEFKVRVATTFPEMKTRAVPISAGQLFRFAYEMQAGDWIVYPQKSTRQIHIGRIEGQYQYSPAENNEYPHQRAVKWIKTLPRTAFSQGALYEAGSASTLFQIKNYADEYLAALDKKVESAPAAVDDTVVQVSAEIEQTTRDFIMKSLAQKMKGHPLAHFVAHIMNAMGYRTRVSPEGADGGIDIIAHKDELGFEPPIIKVQVKSSQDKVGDPVVSALYGKVDVKEFGLLVTLGSFTPPAKNFAQGKSNLRLIDGEELIDLILQHYEQFDSRYKSLLPLKRVYIPDAEG